MNNTLKQFEKQQYLNIETFRKNGQGVKTPVWFAEDEETLRIWTQADSGKLKRIRRDGKVRITPSTASGEPLGKWTDANAAVLESSEEVNHTVNLFKKKYGFMFHVFGLFGKMRGATYATIRINVNSPSSK
jgi:uncharacterized protein